MKWFDTPTNCVWLLSSIENSFLVISAAKTPCQPVPARCQSSGEWVKEKKQLILIIKIWLTPKQRAVIVHCAFVFNFPQVFNHNIWHLSPGGLCDVTDGKGTFVVEAQQSVYIWCFLHVCIKMSAVKTSLHASICSPSLSACTYRKCARELTLIGQKQGSIIIT